MIRLVGALICRLRHGHSWCRSLRQMTCTRCGLVVTAYDLKERR